MAQKQKTKRDVTISFTRISEDVIIPTWLDGMRKGDEYDRMHPIKTHSVIWWGLAGFWLLSILLMHSWFGTILATSSVLIFAIFFVLLMRIPTYWLEFNRTDGYVTCWKSPEKKQLYSREHIDNLLFQANRIFHSTNSRLGRGEYRFYINLYYRNAIEKKRAFCTVFNLFADDKIMAEPDWEDFFLSGALAHRIDAFVRDFMLGKPVPLQVKSVYTINEKN